jgi:hypothetical protein
MCPHYNPSTEEMRGRRIHRFEASLDYIVRSCLEPWLLKNKKQTNKKMDYST